MSQKTKVVTDNADASLSLYHLLDPETRACPYPLYHRLRERDPVHWDAYLHAWVVTRYDDVVTVLQHFSAERSPTPEQLTALGLPELNPIAQVLVRQMLFMDAPSHTRLRALAAAAFTPSRAEALRSHIQDIVDGLIDAVHDVLDVRAERFRAGRRESRSCQRPQPGVGGRVHEEHLPHQYLRDGVELGKAECGELLG